MAIKEGIQSVDNMVCVDEQGNHQQYSYTTLAKDVQYEDGTPIDEIYKKDSVSINRKNGTTVGENSIAIGDEHYPAEANGTGSISIGMGSKADGDFSIAIGEMANATQGSIAISGTATPETEDDYNPSLALFNGKAKGGHSIAFNSGEATGIESIAIGTRTKATGNNSVAIGHGNEVNGESSIAIGTQNEVSGDESFVFGTSNGANGSNAFVIGKRSAANGNYSHAIGQGLIANGKHQTVVGKFNEIDNKNEYAAIVGGGALNERKNIATIDWNGNTEFAGEVSDKDGNLRPTKTAVATYHHLTDTVQGHARLTDVVRNLWTGNNNYEVNEGSSGGFQKIENVLPNKSYVISYTKERISGKTIANQYAYIINHIDFYDNNDKKISTVIGNSAPKFETSMYGTFNFDTPPNTSYAMFYLGNRNGDTNVNTLVRDIMLELGSTPHPYVPYGGYDVRSCGKNIADPKNVLNNKSTHWFSVGNVHLKANTNYYIGTDKNNNSPEYLGIPSGKIYCNNGICNVKSDYDGDCSLYFKSVSDTEKIMFAISDIALPYEPYHEETVTITPQTDVAYIPTYADETNIFSYYDVPLTVTYNLATNPEVEYIKDETDRLFYDDVEGSYLHLTGTKNGKVELSGFVKNFIMLNSLPITNNGLTISKDSNNNIIVNGEPTNKSGYTSLVIGYIDFQADNDYFIKLEGKNVGIGIAFSGDDDIARSINIPMNANYNTTSYSFSKSYHSNIIINISNTSSKFTNYVLNPIIDYGKTPHPYVPYDGYEVKSSNADGTKTSTTTITPTTETAYLDTFDGETNIFTDYGVELHAKVPRNDVGNDILEVKTNSNSYVLNSEIPIGTWIDGKIIYRSVVLINDVNNFKTNETLELHFPFSHVDRFINSKMIVYRSSGVLYDIIQYGRSDKGSESVAYEILKSDTDFFIELDTMTYEFNNKEVYLVAEYTKK